jgi:N-acetylglutamate synthase-like GNAT family acetyltransferase
MSFDVYELFWINVKNEYHNKGIGKFLIEDIENDIRKQETHYDHYSIIFATNKAYFYEKIGYKTIFMNYDKDVIMIKSV